MCSTASCVFWWLSIVPTDRSDPLLPSFHPSWLTINFPFTVSRSHNTDNMTEYTVQCNTSWSHAGAGPAVSRSAAPPPVTALSEAAAGCSFISFHLTLPKYQTASLIPPDQVKNCWPLLDFNAIFLLTPSSRHLKSNCLLKHITTPHSISPPPSSSPTSNPQARFAEAHWWHPTRDRHRSSLQ